MIPDGATSNGAAPTPGSGTGPDRRRSRATMLAFGCAAVVALLALTGTLLTSGASENPPRAGLPLAITALLLTAATVVLGLRDTRWLRSQSVRTADALRRNRALWSLLNNHTLLSITDRRGRIVAVNDGFCQISGYDREELLGQDHRILNSGHHPKEFWVDMWRTISTGQPWRAEVCNRAKDGALYWVDSTNVPQFDEAGRIGGYISLRFDITEKKQIESELRAAQQVERLLGDLGVIATDATAAREAIERTLRSVCQTLGWELGHAYRVSSDDEELEPTGIWHVADPERHAAFIETTARSTFRRGVGLPGRVLETGRAAWIEDVAKVTDSPRFQQCTTFTVHGAAAFPVRVLGRVDTVLEFFVTQPLQQDQHQLASLDLLGVQLGHFLDRQRAREQVHALQQRFEDAIAGASEGLWDFDPTSGQTWYSDTFRKLVGLEPDDPALGGDLDAFLDLLHPDDKARTQAAINAHLRDGTAYDIEYRLRTAAGPHRWFRARGQSICDEAGHVVRMAGSLTDIQEQHTAESRLDLATRAARVGLWDWDLDTNETYFSDTFYTMLGYQPGEMPMHLDTWRALAHPDDLEDTVNDIQRHLAGDVPFYANEHRLRCRDGSWLWIRDCGEIVERHADGRPRRMIGVHIDIHQQVEARLVLEELSRDLRYQTERAHTMAARAEAASVAKSEFLANMSHEIRTPMTAILGYTDLLIEELNLDAASEQQVNAVRTIQRNGQHLLGVINDILDLSKIEAGRLHVERTSCSPCRLLGEVAGLMGVRARERGIAFRVEPQGPLPETIHSDPLRLRQILLNLVGNAIKFTEHGTVRLLARLRPGPAPSLELDIVDTGIGMTSAQAERLFQPFVQADTSMARRFGGTGLGLAISQRLAAMLGGEIRIVRTAPNEGTTMRVSIDTGPLNGIALLNDPGPAIERASADPSIPPRSDTGDAEPLRNLRILLAEDGPDNQRLLSHLLRRAGAEVDLADNGRAAVNRAGEAVTRDRPYAVILMDMQMPIMNGYEATSLLREQGYRGKIVALTAHAMGGEMEKCLEAGCDGYLSKPINRATLIRGVLAHARPPAAPVDGSPTPDRA